MSASIKKRKLLHPTVRTPAGGEHKGIKAAAPASADLRFQIDSDFDDSGDEEHQELGADPSSVKKGAAREQTTKRKSSLAQRNRETASDGSGSEDPDLSPEVESSADGDDEDLDPRSGKSANDSDGGIRARRASGRGAGSSGKGFSEQDGGSGDSEGQGPSDDEQQGAKEQRKKRPKVLTKRKLERVKEASERRGIVYISRIPPHMKPHKLRQLLEPFGEIGRVYCAPEDPALRRMRKKKGGNSGKNFTEGWVEFEDKRRAKRAALALNGQAMGGSKRSAYFYDLWNMKYLPKFKWDTLTEEINYQRAVREQRLVAEISAAKRERDFYLSRVDKAKAIQAIQERRAKKQQPQDGPGQAPGVASGSGATAGEAAGGDAAPAARQGPLERHFGQRRAKADPVSDDKAHVLADDVLGLLGRKK